MSSVNTSQRYTNPIFHYGFYTSLFIIAAATLFYHTLGHSVFAKTDTKCGSNAPQKVIQITETGFSPNYLEVKKCTEIVFENADKKMHQPAFGEHEHHDPKYVPSERKLFTGQKSTFTLDSVGKFYFHDHVAEEFAGEVVVK